MKGQTGHSSHRLEEERGRQGGRGCPIGPVLVIYLQGLEVLRVRVFLLNVLINSEKKGGAASFLVRLLIFFPLTSWRVGAAPGHTGNGSAPGLGL